MPSKGSPRVSVRIQRVDYVELKAVAPPDSLSKFIQDAIRRRIREKRRVSDVESNPLA